LPPKSLTEQSQFNHPLQREARRTAKRSYRPDVNSN
jgi:hypothetical protein